MKTITTSVSAQDFAVAFHDRATYYTNPFLKHLKLGVAKLQLRCDQIHALGQLNIEGAQTGFVVSSEHNVNSVPKIVPIRMMLIALCQLRSLRHEVEGLLKVLEHEGASQRVASNIVLDQSPIWNSLGVLIGLLRSQADQVNWFGPEAKSCSEKNHSQHHITPPRVKQTRLTGMTHKAAINRTMWLESEAGDKIRQPPFHIPRRHKTPRTKPPRLGTQRT